MHSDVAESLAPIPARGWETIEPLFRQRLAAGISPGELSAVMNANLSYVRSVERGLTPVTPKFRERYANGLRRLLDLRGPKAAP